MRTICLYFQVHQPFRFRRYRFFDIGNDHYYYDDYSNESILHKVAQKCYLPANELMLDLIKKNKGRFKISYSISGIAMEQFRLYAPEVLESFKKLADTGSVEFLSETYAHSLSSLKGRDEFERQVRAHDQLIKEHFGQEPTVFRNTELIYSDEIGAMVADMGFKAMLTEGAKHVLGWKSPNYLYCNAINPKLKLLLKNFKLSDDIAFRFSNQGWPEYPLTADKYVDWLNQTPENEEVINLFMDYETFGEHQWKETGIFDFLEALPKSVFKNSPFTFSTPSEVAKKLQVVSAVNVPNPISWADEERDLTAWLGNEMQNEAFNKLYSLGDKVYESGDEGIKQDYAYLQVSDHFYYMSTKFFSDGEVHSYFNPYDTPYDAFINYMNVLSDFEIRVNAAARSGMDDDVARLSKIIKEKDDQLEKLESRIAASKKPTASTKKSTAAKKPASTKKSITTKTTASSKKRPTGKKS
ncbi:MAG: polysaccharide deacetylase family protein [Bacteroidetes bacterium]|nr:polysaccharide deacetylase family protein [Bacteroidota bacterium]